MPSKIIFEAEEPAMEEKVDTVADVKPLKVNRTCRVALDGLKKSVYLDRSPARLLHV